MLCLFPASLDALIECRRQFRDDALISPQFSAGADEVGALPSRPRPGAHGLCEHSTAVSWRRIFAPT